jgi:Mce-associated membrane protein
MTQPEMTTVNHGAAVLAKTEAAHEEPTVPAAPSAVSDTEAKADRRRKRWGVRSKRRISWSRILAYGMLPALVLLLAIAAAYGKWVVSSSHDSDVARVESVRAATDSTIAILSYKPDTVDKELEAARDRSTGTFRDSYTSLIRDVVIPGSKQKHIAAMANVPAAASVSATGNRAVVLAFINQTITIGDDPPTNTASSVRIILEKIDGKWLISQFEPV